MPENKGLKTREWLMVLFIFMLGQYVMTVWIRGYGNESNIVSYVSFASTIVSIILAVLAIVYTNFQNAAQQRDSNSIETQILRLQDIVTNVKDTTAKLESEVGGTRTIASHIEELTKEVSDLQSGLVELQLREKVGVIRRNTQRIGEEKAFPVETLLYDSLAVIPLYRMFDVIPLELQLECTDAICRSLSALEGQLDIDGTSAQDKLVRRIEELIPEIQNELPTHANKLRSQVRSCSSQGHDTKQEG
jgi:archaellum component FlaC